MSELTLKLSANTGAVIIRKNQQVKLRRRQLIEDAFPIHEEIRNAIACVYVFCFVVSVLAERIVLIVDPDLRDQRKHALTECFRSRDKAGQRREDRGANKTHQPG